MLTRSVLLQLARAIATLIGALAGASVLGAMVIATAMLRARKLILARQAIEEPRAQGTFGAGGDGPELQLVMLGDSLAVGVGADEPSETLGAILAEDMARLSRSPVTLFNVAVTGSESRDLASQLAELRKLTEHPDVAVIIIGGNDVMHRNSITTAVRHLYRAVLALRKMDCRVVVATCPDMGTVRPLIQPLRYLAHRASRALATAQTLVVLRAGGRPVPLGASLGPIFGSKPKLMFSTDHFHPSALGYARAAAVLLPSVSAAGRLSLSH